MLLPGDVVMLTVWRRDGKTHMRCTACKVACEGSGSTWGMANSRLPCKHGMMELAADDAAGAPVGDGGYLEEYGRELSRREGVDVDGA